MEWRGKIGKKEGKRCTLANFIGRRKKGEKGGFESPLSRGEDLKGGRGRGKIFFLLFGREGGPFFVQGGNSFRKKKGGQPTLRLFSPCRENHHSGGGGVGKKEKEGGDFLSYFKAGKGRPPQKKEKGEKTSLFYATGLGKIRCGPGESRERGGPIRKGHQRWID